MEHSSAQHVDVEMKHGLAGPGSVVDDGAESLRFYLPLASKLGADSKQMAYDSFVFLLGFAERCDVLSRNHQKVYRRLGIRVLKRYDGTVLVNDFGRRPALDNATKDAAFHGISEIRN